MKANQQVFILLINLCLCRGSDGAGHQRFVRKEAIVMTPTGGIEEGHQRSPNKEAIVMTPAGGIENIPIKASKGSMLARVQTTRLDEKRDKEQSNRHSMIEGKIEQGGKCLAAKRHSVANPTDSGDHELELVSCSGSDDDDEEWEALSDIEMGDHTPIELADDGLCLQADHNHHHVELKPCSNATLHTHHHRQLWTYDNHTNEIKMAVRAHHTHAINHSNMKCLTSHDHDSDGDLDLVLHACSSPTPTNQDWVFDDGSTAPAHSSSSTMIEGKLKQGSKCIAAHKTSNADEDLEVVSCGGDGDDDEEWEANAEIKTDHASHSAQPIMLESSSSTKLCLQADSLFHEVELQPCHTHTHHHRQMWTYDPTDEEIKIESPSGEKCLESSADADGAEADEDGPDDDLVLADCASSGQDLSEQEWKWE